MARNRLLFDILGIAAGVAIAVPIALFVNLGGDYGDIGISAGSFLIGGFVLGFLAYKNDGIKIAGALSGILIILGIIGGVLIFTIGETLAETMSENLLGALIGIPLGVGFIVVGIIMIVVLIVASLLFVAASGIGSAIGEAVWKDKKGDVEVATVATGAYQPINPAQAAYQPVQQPAKPVKQAGEVFCTHCGATNVAVDEFCTSCGGKLKKQ